MYISTNEDDIKYYLLNIHQLNMTVVLLLVTYFVFYLSQKSTRPVITLNTKHEQTLTIRRLWKGLLSSMFDKALRDWMQYRNRRNTVQLRAWRVYSFTIAKIGLAIFWEFIFSFVYNCYYFFDKELKIYSSHILHGLNFLSINIQSAHQSLILN